MATDKNETASGERAMLRHTLATLAYRAEKVLRDVSDGFANQQIAPGVRTPLELVGHLGDLMAWATRTAQGQWVWKAESVGEWNADVDRFYAGIAELDQVLASDTPLGHPAGVIFQGPIADALTHVGQLAMLRRLAGAPVRPESYGRAQIAVGRVGRDQSAERREFDGDASKRP
jgi:hypothetical protein